MEKPRSYVVFKDGHEEDIIKYDKVPYKNGITFTTKSGVYDYIEGSRVINEDGGFKFVGKSFTSFRKLLYNSLTSDAIMTAIDDIDYIVIDNRIPYTYDVCTKGKKYGFCGIVLAPPNATEEAMKRIIMNDIYISYEKMEV